MKTVLSRGEDRSGDEVRGKRTGVRTTPDKGEVQRRRRSGR